jgi:hypothetical protein
MAGFFSKLLKLSCDVSGGAVVSPFNRVQHTIGGSMDISRWLGQQISAAAATEILSLAWTQRSVSARVSYKPGLLRDRGE